jgi:hypothetical protein
VPAVPPGFYAITVTQTGFRTWSLGRLQLTVGERRRISPQLQVGEVVEKVQVDAAVELVQTERGAVESVVEQRQIREDAGIAEQGKMFG